MKEFYKKIENMELIIQEELIKYKEFKKKLSF